MFFSYFKLKKGLPAGRQGFTLVEMVVVLAIFTIMTVVVLANLPDFRSKTALDLLAEEVAITIRQAQVFGVGVREFEGKFPSHGVYFNLAGDNKGFILFADIDGAGYYDPPGELREQFLLRGNVSFTGLAGCTGADPDPCPDALNILQILFVRPNVEAVFSDGVPPPAGYSYVKIELTDNSRSTDETREILIWNTGHIYACNPSQSSC